MIRTSSHALHVDVPLSVSWKLWQMASITKSNRGVFWTAYFSEKMLIVFSRINPICPYYPVILIDKVIHLIRFVALCFTQASRREVAPRLVLSFEVKRTSDCPVKVLIRLSLAESGTRSVDRIRNLGEDAWWHASPHS